jgi:hypothetical protein
VRFIILGETLISADRKSEFDLKPNSLFYLV